MRFDTTSFDRLIEHMQMPEDKKRIIEKRNQAFEVLDISFDEWICLKLGKYKELQENIEYRKSINELFDKLILLI